MHGTHCISLMMRPTETTVKRRRFGPKRTHGKW